MKGPIEYRFQIDAFTRDSIPMARLAEYMSDLAALLGEKERVHFVCLDEGSVVLVQKVETEAVLKVQRRLEQVASDDLPEDALRAYKAIDSRLAEDNAVGSLKESAGAEVIRFLGRDNPKQLTFGAFSQQGSLDGVLIKVGGKDETVPVHLEEGNVIHLCNASRDLARDLARHLFVSTLRVNGNGRWVRDADGNWYLKRFNIAGYEVLDDAPLSDIVDQIRQVSGNGWKAVDDPYDELQRLRQGQGEIH